MYVALGDSISIDEYADGPGRGGASLLHRNHDADFPQWRGRDLHSLDPRARFWMLATDGATTHDVRDVQLPRLAALPLGPTLVTLTVGGNDLLAAYGDTAAARGVVARVRTEVLRTVDSVSGALARGGQVVVGTVYDPSDGTGDTARLGLPPWPDAVPVIGELNAALREAAQTAGAVVAEIHERFLGHGVTAGPAASSQARPAQSDLWLCSVIEPNAWGASGVRAAFWDAAGLPTVR